MSQPVQRKSGCIMILSSLGEAFCFDANSLIKFRQCFFIRLKSAQVIVSS